MFVGGNWGGIHYYSQNTSQSGRFLIQSSSFGQLKKPQSSFGKDFAGFAVEAEKYLHTVSNTVGTNFG